MTSRLLAEASEVFDPFNLSHLGFFLGYLVKHVSARLTFLAAPLAITLFGESLFQLLAVTALVSIAAMTAFRFRSSATATTGALI